LQYLMGRPSGSYAGRDRALLLPLSMPRRMAFSSASTSLPSSA